MQAAETTFHVRWSAHGSARVDCTLIALFVPLVFPRGHQNTQVLREYYQGSCMDLGDSYNLFVLKLMISEE